jgi:hypothetical protein
VKVGLAALTSAAAPATVGAEADVPAKPLKPAQFVKAPYVNPDIWSWPVMSGFLRPSIVGPWALKGSMAVPFQHWAPTAKAYGEVAGSTTLPAAVLYWRSGPVYRNKSMRGDLLVA